MQMVPSCLLLVLLQQVIAAAELVTFHKTYADGEFGGKEGGCAQANIPRELASNAIAFGLAEGYCQAQGYAIPNGQKSIDFPGLGTIEAHFYRKGAASDDVTMYHSEDDDSCGQIKVAKAKVKELEGYGLTVGTCGFNGYGVPGGTDKVNIPGVGPMTANFFFKKAPEKVRSGYAMYKVSTDDECEQFHDCKCIQTLIPEKFDPETFELQGLLKGSCASQNYPIQADTKHMNLPKLGNVLVDVFKKDLMTVHQVAASGTCQEAKILKSEKSIVVEPTDTSTRKSPCEGGYICDGMEACGSEGYNVNSDCSLLDVKKSGLQEGTCASAGYTEQIVWKEAHFDMIKGHEVGIRGPIFSKEGKAPKGMQFCCSKHQGVISV